MASPDRLVAAYRASHDRLRALVEPLGPDDVRRGSYASEWTIAQVLSHLGSGAQIFCRRLAAALADAAPPTQEETQRIWDEWDAKSPDVQVADALVADRTWLDDLRALDPERLEAVTIQFGPMKLGAETFLWMRLAEHALHTWDVAVVLDPAATVAPDAVEELVDGLPMMAARVAKPTVRTSVVVHTTSPERDLVLTLGDGVASLTPGSQGDARLTLPAEAFLRLVYGRLDAEHTPPEIEAEGVDLDDLRRSFPGF